MAEVFKNVVQFRKSFNLVNKSLLQWFPGHMNKGLKQMQQKLKIIDCVIEVHDARIPFSGRNPNLRATISEIKPHILVLNKKDLTDCSQNAKIIERLARENIQHVIYTNCKDDRCPGVKKILPLMLELIEKSDRYNRKEEKDHNIMVIGVPNVGKSSLLNTLRNRHLKLSNASPVGAVAGITRSVLTKIRISEEPPIFMLDTPGIMTPNVGDIETGLKLALCATLQDHLVGEDVIADYLLYWLNKHKKYEYVELMGLKEPSDDISEVLNVGAIKMNQFKKTRSYDKSIKFLPDVIAAARHMNRAFRSGKLGRILLDRDILNIIEDFPAPREPISPYDKTLS